MTDSQLVRSYLGGDASAFEELVNRHGSAVLSFLVHLTGDRDRADDLFQETFLKALDSLGHYRDRQKLRSWLIKIAHRTALDDMKRVGRRASRVSVDSEAVPAASGPARLPDAAFEERERLEMVFAAVTALPEKQRRVFLLRQQGDLTFREIAELTEQPLGTVISQMGYAVKHLRMRFNPPLADPEVQENGNQA